MTRTLEVLSATPATVLALLGGLSDEWTASPAADDWGPFDVVGHLIHADETVWIPRSRVMIEQGEDITFPPNDPGGHSENVRGKTLAQLIDEFEAVRRRSLDALAGWNLSADRLDLPGIHPAFGPVILRQMLAAWTVHDLAHIRQIVTSMAKRYDQAVGPWREYLTILK